MKQREFLFYKCKCGYIFENDLGKYGCPNCCKYVAKPLFTFELTNNNYTLNKIKTMAKLKLKGWFDQIHPVTEIGDKKTKKQTIIFTLPGFRDEYNGIDRDPEPWQISIIGKKVDELNLTVKDCQRRAEIEVFIKGYQATSKDGVVFFGYEVNLFKVEFKA